MMAQYGIVLCPIVILAAILGPRLVQAIPAERFGPVDWKESLLSYHAVRESYAFVSKRENHARFHVGQLVTNSEQLRAPERSHESPAGDVDERQQSGSVVRLLVIDSIPGPLLERYQGPSLHVTLFVPGDVYISCRPADTDIQVTTVHTGSKAQVNTLHTVVTYNRKGNRLTILLKSHRKVNNTHRGSFYASIFGRHSDVSIQLPCRRVWNRQSYVTFHKPNGHVHVPENAGTVDFALKNTRCIPKKRITVKALTSEMCLHNCAHWCNATAQECQCHTGYVPGIRHPGRCLLTAVVELDVPRLSSEIQNSLYCRKHLEALFCLSLTDHLRVADEEVKEVRFGADKITILLVEQELHDRSTAARLEDLAGRIMGMAQRQEVVFDLFDFDMPPVTGSREIYPSATGRYTKPRSTADDSMFSMSLSRRDAVDDAVAQGNHSALLKSALEQIRPERVRMSELARGVGRQFVDEIRALIPSFDLDSIKLPESLSLTSMDLMVSSTDHTQTGVKVCAHVPKRFERSFAVANLQLVNLTLCVDLYIQTDMFVRSVKTTVSGSLPLPSASLEGSISLSINGTTTAVLHLAARKLKVFELLAPVLGSRLSNQLKSNGFMDMTVDYISMDLVFGRRAPILAIFHIEISSMANFAKVMFKNGGTISGIAAKINLQKLFSKFNIKNVNATVILKAGKVSFSMLGHPTLPQLGLNSAFELSLGNIGAAKSAYRALKLGIPSFNFVDALSTFIPSLSSLKTIKGLGQLRIPEFGFSMATGIKTYLPDVKLLEFNYPPLSLLKLLPSHPGVNFITKLVPTFKRGQLPRLGVTMLGNFLRGGFSLQRLKNVKGAAFSLDMMAHMFFPSFNLSSVRLPSAMSGFLKASINNFRIDSKLKLASFTVILGPLNLLKGIWPKANIASSRLTFISLAIGYKSLPYSWDFNATCIGTFFNTSGKAIVKKAGRSFEFLFSAHKISIMSFLGNSAGSGLFSSLLKRFGVLKLSIDKPSIRLITRPTTLLAVGSLKIGTLPAMRCAFLGMSMFTKNKKSTYSLGMEITNTISLSALIKTFLNIDISAIPFFGSLKFPRASLLFMPRKLNVANLKLFDKHLSQLAAAAMAHRRSLMVAFPIRFPKVGLLNVTSALYNLEIDFKIGNASLSVPDLLTAVLPKGIGLTKLPSFFGALDKLYVLRFLLKWKTAEFAIHSLYHSSVTLAKNIISLSNIDIRLAYVGKVFHFSFSTDAVLMQAMQLRMNVTKSGSLFVGRLGSTAPFTLGKLFGKSSFANTLSALHLSVLSVREFLCEVRFTTAMQFQRLSISGKTAFAGAGPASLELYLRRGEGSAARTTLLFAFCMRQVSVVTVAKVLTGRDVSTVPLLDRLAVDQLTVLVATYDATLPAATLRGCAAATNQSTFKQGFTFAMSFTDRGRRTTMFLSFSGSNILISVQDLSVMRVIKLFFPSFSASSLHMPNGFPRIDEMTVSKILFDSKAKQANFTVNIGSFRLPKNIITCHKIVMDLSVDYSRKPTNYSFTAGCEGTFLSHSIDFDLAMAGKTVNFHANLKSLSLYSLLSHGSLADSGFMQLLSEFNLLNITMYNTSIDMKTNPSELALLGHVSWGSVHGIQLELLAKNAFSSEIRVMTMGLVVPEIKLSQLIRSLFRMIGFSEFPTIGEVVLDQVRLLALPKGNSSLTGLKFVDSKLNKLLSLANEVQSKLQTEPPQRVSVLPTHGLDHHLVTSLQNLHATVPSVQRTARPAPSIHGQEHGGKATHPTASPLTPRHVAVTSPAFRSSPNPLDRLPPKTTHQATTNAATWTARTHPTQSQERRKLASQHPSPGRVTVEPLSTATPPPAHPQPRQQQQQAVPQSLKRRRWRVGRSTRSLLSRAASKLAGMLTVSFPGLNLVDLSSLLSARRIDFNLKLNTVTIAALVEKFFSRSVLNAIQAPSFLPALEKIYVNRFLVDFTGKLFRMNFAVPGQLTVIKNYLSFSNISAGLQYRAKTFDFNISTSAEIANTLRFSAQFSKKGAFYHLVGRSPDFKVGALLSSLGSLGSVFKEMHLTDFTIKKAGLDVTWGAVDTSMSVYGSPTMTNYETARVQVTLFNITRPNDAGFFIGFDVKQGKLAALVKSLSSVDISNMPMIGNLRLPELAIWISNRPLEIGEMFSFRSSNPIFHDLRDVEKGINFYFQMKIKSREFLVGMGAGAKMINLQLPRGISLHEILDYFLPSLVSTPAYKAFSKSFGFIFRLQVMKVLYDANLGETMVSGSLMRVLELFNGKLRLEKAMYKATIVNRNFAMKISGIVVLFGIPFHTFIEYNTEQSEFIFKLHTRKNLKLTDLLNAISTKIAKNKFVKKLQLDKFAINHPSVELIRTHETYAVEVAGEPSLPLFGSYAVDVIITKLPNLYVLILSRRDTTLTDVFKSITGIDLSKMFFFHLFAGPADIGLTYTNAEKRQEFPFKIETYPLHDTRFVPEGLSLFFEIGLPVCGKDKLCVFFKKLFGSRKFKLEILDIGKSPRITLDAPISGHLKIGGFDLHAVRFGVVLGAAVQFGLTHAEVDVQLDRNNRLHFVGDLTTDPAMNVEMSFEMQGIWRKAFFLPFLSFGNVIMRVRVNADCPICVSAYEFGGEVWIGSNCRIDDNKTKCIMGRGYFGSDAEEPDKNYCFFSVNQFSYGKLLTAVGVGETPFSKILEYWSMESVLFSYSIISRTVPHGNTTQAIPSGIVFRGNFTFLWALKVSINVRVYAFNGIPTGVVGTVFTNPVKLGNFVHLTSSKDSRKGAIFSLKAGVLPPAFRVELSAKLTVPVLKILVDVTGNISTKGISFHFDARLVIFDVTMDLSALFKSPLRPKSFQGFKVSGFVKQPGLKYLWQKVKLCCEIAKRKAEEFLRKANISKALKDIIANKKAAEAVRNAREAAKRKAAKALKSAEDTVNGICKISNCKVCGVPKPCTKSKCSCALKYPCGWGKWCCKHVCVPYPSFCGKTCLPVKPACLAQNAACLPVRAAAFAARKVAQASLDTANKALDGAQKAYMKAAAAFAKYNPAILAARALLALAAQAVSAITAIVDAFRFEINEITFNAELGAVSEGFLAASIDVTYEGKRTLAGVRLNLKNIMVTAWGLAKKFFAKIFDWLKRLKISI